MKCKLTFHNASYHKRYFSLSNGESDNVQLLRLRKYMYEELFTNFAMFAKSGLIKQARYIRSKYICY